jgi:hypothetical protein
MDPSKKWIKSDSMIDSSSRFDLESIKLDTIWAMGDDLSSVKTATAADKEVTAVLKDDEEEEEGEEEEEVDDDERDWFGFVIVVVVGFVI